MENGKDIPTIYKIIDRKKLEVVNKPITKSHGLPNECYISEDYTKIERKKLFEDKWIVVGTASSIPKKGDAKPFNFLDLPIIILRDKKIKLEYFIMCAATAVIKFYKNLVI